MADFTAKIRAVLDAKGIESQIQNLTKNKQLDIKVNLKGATADIDKFLNGLKNQAQSAGQNVGSNLANSINNSLGKINLKNSAQDVVKLQTFLRGFNLDNSSIRTVTKDLTNMELAIQKIETSSTKNGLKFNITGVQETEDGVRRVVSVVKEFDSQTGNITETGRKITETFRQIKEETVKMASMDQVRTFSAQMTTWLNNNDKSTNVYRSSVKQLQTDLRGLANAGQVPEAELKRLQASFKTFSEQAKAAGVAGKEVVQAVQKMASIEQIGTLDAKMTSWLSGNNKSTNFYSAEVQKLQQELRNLASAGQVPLEKLQALENRLKMFSEQAKAAGVAGKEIQQSFASLSQINTLDAKMSTWLNNNNKSTNFYRDSVKGLQDELRKLASAGKIPEDALKDLETRFRTFGEQAKAAGVSGKEAIEKMASGSQIAKLDAQMTTWLNNNTKGNNTYRQSVQELQNSLRGLAASGQFPIGTLREMSGQFSAFSAQARAAGVAGKSFGDTLKSAFSSVSTYFSAAAIMSKSVSTIRDMARNVLEVDTALTELYRVSDLSEKQYDKLYQGMTQSAKEYGVALSDIIDSTASWVRLGFDPKDASGLAEITAMYQHVTDLDNSTAVNNLVTAYKGFEKQLMEVSGGDSTKAVERAADIFDALGG